MPQATAQLLELARALREAHERLSQVLTRPPEPEEIPAFCRQFFPHLEVAYVVRQDTRDAFGLSTNLEELGRGFDTVLLDPSVESDGVHYRTTPAMPWRGPFPDYSTAYGEAWAREVCG